MAKGWWMGGGKGGRDIFTSVDKRWAGRKTVFMRGVRSGWGWTNRGTGKILVRWSYWWIVWEVSNAVESGVRTWGEICGTLMGTVENQTGVCL